MDQLQERLTAAEEALAAKQDKIDQMKQEIFHKEKELETISVFQAQVSGRVNVLTPMLKSYVWLSGFSFMAVILFFFPLRAGGGLLLRLLRGASSEGETA